MPRPSDFFQCQMCGDCCKGYGGTFLTENDVDVISAYLTVDRSTFLEQYCQWSGRRPVIRTGPLGYCIFWDQLCTIHEVKPRMCKLWPFIESVLVDPLNWTTMHSMCPGIRTDVDETALMTCIRQELLKHGT